MKWMDPERLSDGEELSEELRVALRDLASEEPGPEAVQHVEQALDALSSAPASTGLTAVTKIVSVTTLVGLAVVVAIGLQLSRPDASEGSEERRSAAPALAGAPRVQELNGGTASPDVEPEGAAFEAAVRADADGVRANGARSPDASRARSHAPRSRQEAPVRAGRTTVANALTSASPRVPEPSADVAATAPANESADQTSPATDRDALGQILSAPEPPERVTKVAPRAAPTPVKREDEAALLYRARQAAMHDEKEALALLDVHRRLFPRSALAEEREFMVIGLYRRLGDHAAAEEQRARFRARFPQSAYSHILEP